MANAACRVSRQHILLFFFFSILADGVLCEYNVCGEGVLLFHSEHEQPSGGGGGTEACGSVGKSWVDGGFEG